MIVCFFAPLLVHTKHYWLRTSPVCSTNTRQMIYQQTYDASQACSKLSHHQLGIRLTYTSLAVSHLGGISTKVLQNTQSLGKISTSEENQKIKMRNAARCKWVRTHRQDSRQSNGVAFACRRAKLEYQRAHEREETH